MQLRISFLIEKWDSLLEYVAGTIDFITVHGRVVFVVLKKDFLERGK